VKSTQLKLSRIKDLYDRMFLNQNEKFGYVKYSSIRNYETYIADIFFRLKFRH